MPNSLLRKITKKFIASVNIFIGIAFLLGCYAAWFNPKHFWFLGLLTLAAPYLLLVLLMFLVFWLFAKKKLMLLSIIFIALAWKPIGALFKFNLSQTFTSEKTAQTLRVMSWNVEHFCILEYKKNPNKKLEMLALINEYNPDVACFQEVVGADKDSSAINYIPAIADSLHFPFYYYSYETKDDFDNNHHFGKIIFSRYPILHEQSIFQKERHYNNSFQYVDILKGQDTVRIFNIHLQSLKFSNSNLKYIDDASNNTEINLQESKNIVSKLKTGFIKRQLQSEAVHAEIEKTNLPVIVCGDFNDVPNSYAYATIGKNLQNAFEAKGSLIGRTFSLISPTLRIDNIFVDKKFTVEQFVRVKKKLSDHFPIIADITLVK
jgi:endonuclease/exonuclease/phosphatase family metal-dependent hydrolase